MAIEGVDAQVQSLISQSNLQTQQKISEGDRDDEVRRRAQKKVELKKQAVKSQTASTQLGRHETFSRTQESDLKWRAALGGAAGPDAQDALRNLEGNGAWSGRLTDADRQKFKEFFLKNQKRAVKAAHAFNEVSKQPGFERAANTPQHVRTVHAGLSESPELAPSVSRMLSSRFMQSPKADTGAKNAWLRFGMQQAQRGNLSAVRQSGDMLGTLAEQRMPGAAQRAAMNMVRRTPQEGKAASNVDAFVRHPDVQRMATPARGKATELLAKADGADAVKDGFEQLAGHPKFKRQSGDNQGRFFATIGSGRAGEYRALTDLSLQALQHSRFPTRDAPVRKLLTTMAAQVQKKGTGGVDVDAAIRSARGSAMPKPPALMVVSDGMTPDEVAQAQAQSFVSITDDMDPQTRNRARSHNWALASRYNHAVMRSLENAEKQLSGAKYFEDVNAFRNLREPEMLDLSALHPEDAARAQQQHQNAVATVDRLRKLMREQLRLTRKKRLPPHKRRARAAAQRSQGQQAKWFDPKSRAPDTSPKAVVTPTAAAATGPTAGPGLSEMGSIRTQVASALAQVGETPLTAEQAQQVAKAIAGSVAKQVAEQVAQQLLGRGLGPAGLSSDVTGADTPMPSATATVDRWGVPRALDRDLGGTARAPVRPVVSDDEGLQPDPMVPYTGKRLVKDPSEVRRFEVLFDIDWRSLSRAETALLRNLGWTQQAWDTRNAPKARWPVAMATPFVNLTPQQREAVKLLGRTPPEWDRMVQPFSGGGMT